MSAVRADSRFAVEEPRSDDRVPAVLKSYFLDPSCAFPERPAFVSVGSTTARRKDFDPARVIRRACSAGLRLR
jgi:hypothetical protein